MIIRSISATGFKNLSLTKVTLGTVTLVMGENGIGKSNLLQLVHSLFQQKEPLESEELQFAIDGRLPDEDLICRKEAAGTASVVLATTLPRFRAMCEAFGPKLVKGDANEATLSFRFWRQNGTVFKLSKIEIGSAVIFSDSDPKVKIPDAVLPTVHTWLSDEIQGCTVYVPTNRLLARSLVAFSPESSIDAVDNLENTILRLLSDPSENQELIDAIKTSMAAFFQIEDIRTSLVTRPEPSAEPKKSREHGFREELGRPLSDVGVGIRLREKDREWFDMHQVGSGLQQLLVILTMLHQHRARIALVEEFDSSLSPKLRSDLLQHFVKITGPDSIISQLITTTHGSFLWPKPRPLGLSAKPRADGRVTFETANANYLKKHTLPAVIA